MKWFYNQKISVKLLTSFILVALIAGVVGLIGIYEIKKTDRGYSDLFINFGLGLGDTADIATYYQESRVILRDIILEKDSQKKNQYVKDLEACDQKITDKLEKTKNSLQTEDGKQAYKNIDTAINNFRPVRQKIINLAMNNNEDQALIVMRSEGLPMANAINTAIVNLEDMKKAYGNKYSEDYGHNTMTTIWIMLAVVLVAMVMAVFLGIFLGKILNKPLKQAVEMIQEMSKGNLGKRLDSLSNDEIGIMSKTMNEFADDLQHNVIGVMKKIAEGNVNIDVQLKSDKDEISPAIQKTIETIRGLIDDTGTLITAVQDGRLDTRGNESLYLGSWKDLMSGINRLIEAFVRPIDMTAKYVDRISKGDIPPKITDNYNGDFNEIKQNLNNCIEAINALIYDANTLEKAAEDGRLDTRADGSAHGGDFARIINGVNKTLDAVTAPIIEASEVLQEMAKGNLNISIKGEYKGDHAKIKNALNDTISTIYSYVTEISSILTEIAGGNLNIEIEKDYRGDFAPIKKSLNIIITSLNQILGDMNNASIQVAAGARQVSDSAQALSQGSAEQASSIEELTASMEEILAQTQQNASNATQANELALAVKEGAIEGNEQMQGMLKAMDDINESSGNIYKIIKVIDEIAFQTNILALNAAVEAARAGQHGKGFAVVAEEVRNLAARSANAAKETTALIEGSIKKVEGGTKIANDTAAALNQIVEGVTKATDLVGNIAVASNEQALGINQVNQGILQVSDVVQTNSATSEESAAASEQLSGQADLLREQVSRFKLKNMGTAYKEYEDLNPEVLRMIEEMSQKKKGNPGSFNSGYAEVAATSNKPKISLSDREFGKY